MTSSRARWPSSPAAAPLNNGQSVNEASAQAKDPPPVPLPFGFCEHSFQNRPLFKTGGPLTMRDKRPYRSANR
jgi:hypothetical protein